MKIAGWGKISASPKMMILSPFGSYEDITLPSSKEYWTRPAKSRERVGPS